MLTCDDVSRGCPVNGQAPLAASVVKNFDSASSASPNSGRISNAISYLFPDQNGNRQVHFVDTRTGDVRKVISGDSLLVKDAELSPEEALRRERMRMFVKGIASYEWVYRRDAAGEVHQCLVFPTGNQLLQYDVYTSTTSIVYDGHLGGSMIDPKVSPNGELVAFVCQNDVFVIQMPPLEQSGSSASVFRVAMRLTDSYAEAVARGYVPPRTTSTSDSTTSTSTSDDVDTGVSFGSAEFVAQEEMDRYDGFWWSPDSGSLAVSLVDARQVPFVHVQHVGTSSVPMETERHRYPLAGQTNCTVQLVVVAVPSPTSAWWSQTGDSAAVPKYTLLDIYGASTSTTTSTPTTTSTTTTTTTSSLGEDFCYLCRAGWWPDGSVMAQVQNRSQKVLQLLRLDAATGSRRVLVQESCSLYWINLHNMLHMLPLDWTPNNNSTSSTSSSDSDGSFYFIWSNERSGFMHPYLLRYTPTSTSTSATTTSTSVYAEQVPNAFAPQRASFTTAQDVALQLPAFAYGPLTAGGEYGVDAIIAVDDGTTTSTSDGTSGGYVYFTANKGSAITKSLFRTPLIYSSTSTTTSVDPVECLSDFADGSYKGGFHEILALDIRDMVYMDVYSNASTPPVTYLRSCNPSHPFYKQPVVLQDPRVNNARFERMYQSFRAPIYDTFDGCEIIIDKEVFEDAPTATTTTTSNTPTSTATTATERLVPSSRLHCCVYLPDARTHGPGPYPALVSLYGGPHVQMVADKWTPDWRVHMLTSRGFCVIKVDNRGSARRGIAFEGAVYRNMGEIEVCDQAGAVRHFIEQGIVAESIPVGVYGWSYGGYLSAMCLLRAPDVFGYAMSGAPVTTWDFYDTHYTERYMHLPQCNREGYRRSSTITHVKHFAEQDAKMRASPDCILSPSLASRLLLIHGSIDENVHFRHTARLVAELVEHRVRYDLILFPAARHGPQKLSDRAYLEEACLQFVEDRVKLQRAQLQASLIY